VINRKGGRSLGGVARQHDDLVARARQRLGEPPADEASGAGDQHALPARQRPDQLTRVAEDELLRPARREEVAQAEHDYSCCRQRRQNANDAVPNWNDRGRLGCPANQNGNEKRKHGTVVDGQQRVRDALARRQLSAHILLDEVGERDDDFGPQHGDYQHRPKTPELKQAEREEEHGVGEIARGVELELAALRDPPRQSFHHFVMVDNVKQPERELNGDQDPKHWGGHGAISRNIAIWRMSRPKRGWKTCSVKLNLPSGSSA